MRNVLIFGIGLLLGIGAAAYYFIAVRPDVAVTQTPGVVQTPPAQPLPAPTVVPPPVVVPSSPPPPVAAEAPIVATPAPTMTATSNAPAMRSSDASPPANVARAGELIVPVDGIRAHQLTDTYNQRRGSNRPHEALDIMAPRGTPVLAAADGKIVKLFDSKPGGLTIYEFDTTETLAYYYAHLDRYAAGIAAGLQVKQGAVLGYVGSTGNANPDAPHLHFAIFKLGPEKNWWQGTPINPFPLLASKSGW